MNQIAKAGVPLGLKWMGMHRQLELELGVATFDHTQIETQEPLQQAVVQQPSQQARPFGRIATSGIGRGYSDDVDVVGKTEPSGSAEVVKPAMK